MELTKAMKDLGRTSDALAKVQNK